LKGLRETEAKILYGNGLYWGKCGGTIGAFRIGKRIFALVWGLDGVRCALVQ
jgi:hypothetical protein